MRALLCLTALLATGAPALAAITVDGDASDWTGTPSATIHDVVISDGEWIYTGEVDDYREFGAPGTFPPDYDLTEVRITRDATDLYLLVRFADVTNTNEVSVCLGIDRDRDSGDSNGLGFFGDESGLTFAGGAAEHPEVIVQIHNAQSGITWAEYYDDMGGGTWYSNPGDSATFISDSNDLLEARLSLASLGLTPTSQFDLTLVTFDNGITLDPSGTAFCNDDDTTVDYPDTDALDGIGGTVGVSQNAFLRVFGGAGPYEPVGIPLLDLTTIGPSATVGDWAVME